MTMTEPEHGGPPPGQPSPVLAALITVAVAVLDALEEEVTS